MKISGKYLIVAILIVMLTGILTTQIIAGSEAEGRIAYVDIQEVFDNHPRKAGAEEKLNEMARSMQEDLEKEAKDLSEAKQQEMLNEYQENLSAKEQNLIQDILDDIDKAITEVAEREQVKMVLEKKNVVYGGYDLTQEVISYIKNGEEK